MNEQAMIAYDLLVLAKVWVEAEIDAAVVGGSVSGAPTEERRAADTAEAIFTQAWEAQKERNERESKRADEMAIALRHNLTERRAAEAKVAKLEAALEKAGSALEIAGGNCTTTVRSMAIAGGLEILRDAGFNASVSATSNVESEAK